MAFWDNIHFPYFNLQQLNLDWILTELKRVAGFMPQDGNVGDFLVRKADGAAWEPLEAVDVNINNLPEDTAITDNDQLVFYDISAQANRKIKPPNLLDSMMSNAYPLMDGTADAGTSKKPARYDHKHPTDTSRQAALSGTQMNAVNSGASANCFSGGILGILYGGSGQNATANMSKTYTSQAYITESNFNAITVERWGKVVVLGFNTVFASAPTDDFYEIGKIDMGTDTFKSSKYLIMRSGNASITVQVTSAGIIKIYGNADVNNTRLRGALTILLS